MWMQPAPAHHLGPMRMGLREPAWTNPLCRVASHALFGPRLRSGSQPVPNGLKLPESADLASGNFQNARTHRLVSRLEPAAVPAVSNGSSPLRAIPARHIRRADHGHKPTGSNHPLSRLALAQAGNKSSALAASARCNGNQFIALPADNRTTPTPTKPTSISRPNVRAMAAGWLE
jgi:hypothetical protein